MSIIIKYEEAKRFSGESRGHKIIIDQKLENHGTDRGMMPTELLAASLAGCIGVTIVPFCKRHNVSLKGLEIEANYTIEENPHRIGSMAIRIDFLNTESIDANIKKAILKIANECTIHNTLTNQPKMEIKIN
ncbi:OsmC family protein [Candidatus Poribacteria bacterium]|nr:OsmC family protein [Candidatus Poribacteria bacterium]